MFGFEDALDAFGTHAFAGALGGILTGLLANVKIGGVTGAFYGNGRQLGVQLAGISFTIAYTVVVTYGLLILIDKTIGLKAIVRNEDGQMDASMHGGTGGDLDASVHGAARVYVDETGGPGDFEFPPLFSPYKEYNIDEENNNDNDDDDDVDVEAHTTDFNEDQSHSHYDTNNNNMEGGYRSENIESIQIDK
jgi:Amt family ammonium transporter